jgi:hypothetical protein
MMCSANTALRALVRFHQGCVVATASHRIFLVSGGGSSSSSGIGIANAAAARRLFTSAPSTSSVLDWKWLSANAQVTSQYEK